MHILYRGDSMIISDDKNRRWNGRKCLKIVLQKLEVVIFSKPNHLFNIQEKINKAPAKKIASQYASLFCVRCLINVMMRKFKVLFLVVTKSLRIILY